MINWIGINKNPYLCKTKYANLLLIVILLVSMSFSGHTLPEMKVSKNNDEYADYLQKSWEILELLEPWLPIELDYIKSMDFEFREWYSFAQRNVSISCIEATHSVYINFHGKEFASLSIWNYEYEKNITEITEDTHSTNLKAANEIIKIFDDSFQFNIEDVQHSNTTSMFDNISKYTRWSVMKYYEYTGIRYADRCSLISLYPAESLIRYLIYMPAKTIPELRIDIKDSEAQEIAKKSLLSHEYYKVDSLDQLIASEIPELCIIDLPLEEIYLSTTTQDLAIPEGYVKSDLESARLYWKVELHRITEPFRKYRIYIDAQNGIVLSTHMTL